MTSYRPTPGQTKPECLDRHRCETSIGDGITQYGIAISQDLLRKGAVRYGDVVYVEGYGLRVINDCMNSRIRNSADLLVFTRAEEKKVGVRHLKVYLLEVGNE